MKDFEIRKPLFEERKQVAKLVREAFRESGLTLIDTVIYSIMRNQFEENDLIMIVDNKIIGYHQFEDSNICDGYSISNAEGFTVENYERKRGLSGFVFCIHPDCQKKGYGSKFIQFEKEYFKGRYDYIWGASHPKLNNSGFWKKNRTVFEYKYKSGEIDSYLTIVDL
jgi:GNAT superfamily N-acetyltransferase